MVPENVSAPPEMVRVCPPRLTVPVPPSETMLTVLPAPEMSKVPLFAMSVDELRMPVPDSASDAPLLMVVTPV